MTRTANHLADSDDASHLPAPDAARLLREARARTLTLVADLSEEQMIGPRLTVVNPPLWEIGHVAWTQEFWLLRHLRRHRPLLEGGDELYNSTEVVHDTRWDLPLPAREKTLAYMEAVLNRVTDGLPSGTVRPEDRYFYLLAIFHEDMHAEAMTYTRQTLGYSPPRFAGVTGQAPAEPVPSGITGQAPAEPVPLSGGRLRGDVEVPGGTFILGAPCGSAFVFDNEKWGQPLVVKPFRIARAALMNGEFAEFVENSGYRREEFWSEAGWSWLKTGAVPDLEKSFSKFWEKKGRTEAQAFGAREPVEHPVYWKRGSGGRWHQRVFDAWVPLNENHPVLHVNWYEAEAYCNWAGRRLPTEAEWELAASAETDSAGAGFTERKRIFPWGDEPPTPARANLDWRAMGCAEVSALPDGDSAFGCRQMIGNVWEWMASDFRPFPGFVPDPYKEYSQPWFDTHKVLRGGCWTTRSRLIRNTWRNFYTPDRRDVWAGFRTCAKQKP
jgi:gamma-glutamyl hercynylcysteine S-oxide synthase